jgi:hypothetical protein
MKHLPWFLALFAACTLLFVVPSLAQDQDNGPSLGDVARQSRVQKQKDEAAKPANAASQSAPADAPDKDAQAKGSSTKNSQPGDSKPNKSSNGAQRVPMTKKVITNDEIPEHVGPTRTLKTNSMSDEVEDQPEGQDGKATPEYWRTRIQSQKNMVASLKNDIESLTASIKYAPGNCVSGCVEWNERQQQKQQQVEVMKSQLEDYQKQLEQMQEAARKQGYGSSVYDP